MSTLHGSITPSDKPYGTFDLHIVDASLAHARMWALADGRLFVEDDTGRTVMLLNRALVRELLPYLHAFADDTEQEQSNGK